MDPKWSLLRPRGRAEDQILPRTCPPRVVFTLSRTGHQREASRTPSSAQRSCRQPKPLLGIFGDTAHTPPRSCRRQDLPISPLVLSAATRRATPAALVGDGVSPALKLLIMRRRRRKRRKRGSQSEHAAPLFTVSGGGTPLPGPLSLTGRFWRAELLVALSLAETSGKSIDSPRGVVTSRGPLSSCRGIRLAERRSPHPQHADWSRAAMRPLLELRLLPKDRPSNRKLSNMVLRGLRPPKARGTVFCVGSADVRADTHVGMESARAR